MIVPQYFIGRSIGKYGVGGKSAIFRLGRIVQLESATPDDDKVTISIQCPSLVLNQSNTAVHWDFYSTTRDRTAEEEESRKAGHGLFRLTVWGLYNDTVKYLKESDNVNKLRTNVRVARVCVVFRRDFPPRFTA